MTSDADPPAPDPFDEHETASEAEAGPEAVTRPEGVGFPVVGIGASAGGLRAFQAFFSALPPQPNMAFVLVQHLSPDHESQLAELVQSQTQLSVAQVEDHPVVQADHVYVIPPGKHLEIHDGELRLVDPDADRGRPSAVDRFFRTLAEDMGDRAVAIVLSGTGSDGALGLKTVKESGGLTMVQDPAEADYDGMPRSAVATGLADVVGSATDLARMLIEVRVTADRIGLPSDTEKPTAYRAVLTHLRNRTGHDFSDYKPSTIRRRLARRLQVNGLASLDAYLAFLKAPPAESVALLRDVLISVTQFFRDPGAYEAMEQDIIPGLFEGKTRGETVRVWVPGCATGEEAYSIAMLLLEHRDRTDAPVELQVFATDIDEGALQKARDGIYPMAATSDLTVARQKAFFEEEPSGIRVKASLRDVVLFARHNVISDPPFSRLDLISCRNVLIYLNRSLQRRVLIAFHYALVDRGVVFVGGSEGVDALGKGFKEVDTYARIYRRRNVVLGGERRERFLGRARPKHVAVPVPARTETDFVDRYAAWTAATYGPPRIVVDEHHEVSHVFGGASKYLREREGPVTQNIIDKVLRAFRLDLRAALSLVFRTGESTDTRFHRVTLGTDVRYVRLHVGPVGEPVSESGLAEVVFIELDPASLESLSKGILDTAEGEQDQDHPALARLEDEVRQTRERLQATIEEQVTSNEELKASNEELQSMNEELQSTSEELETSREELQSINEELHTVNQELKNKVDELTRSNADLANLIASTEIATIFLDHRLRVVRYTPAAATLFNLIPGDLGRPFEHLTHRLEHDDLPGLVQGVLGSLRPAEVEVEGGHNRAFSVRAIPYRTADDRIDGVVVSVIDVTSLKRAQQESARRAHQQEAVSSLGQFALRATSLDDVFDRAVHLAAEALGAELAKILSHDPGAGVLRLEAGVGWPEGAVGSATVPDNQGSQAGFTLLSQRPVVVPDLAREARFEGPALLLDNGVESGISVIIPVDERRPYGVLGVHARMPRSFSEDDGRFVEALANVVGEAIRRHRDEITIREQLGEIEAIYASAPVGLATFDRDLRYIRINRQLAAINGSPPEAHIGRTAKDMVPGLGASLYAMYRQVLESGEPIEQVEIRGSTSSEAGPDHIWLATFAPWFDADGTVLGVSAAVQDITARKRQEEALAETTRLLELAMSSGGLGSFVMPVTGRRSQITYDEQAQALLDLPRATPRSILDRRIHADDLDAFRKAVDTACGLGSGDDASSLSAEFRYHHPDGRTMWIAARGLCTQMEEGPARLTGVLFDVTGLKEAEAQLRRQLTEMDAYFDSAPVGIAVFDAAGDLIRANMQLNAFLGRSEDSPIEALGERVAGVLDPMLRSVLAGGEPVRNVALSMPGASTAAGSGSEWLVSLVPLLDEGVPDGAMCVVQDVTALQQALARLEMLTAELEARVAMRTAEVRRLVGDLTEAERRERGRVAQVLHDDLQQLLYAVQFKIEAMRDPADERVAALLEQADELVGRAVHVTRTLSVDLRPPVLKGEGLDRTFEWLGQRMREAYGIDVTVEADTPILAGKTVQVLLFQIVRELLFNVVKHAGTLAATVRVEVASAERVRVVVTDTGAGFVPSEVESQGDSQGAGLLSVRERIRLVGGTVTFHSAPRQGTSIDIECPLNL